MLRAYSWVIKQSLFFCKLTLISSIFCKKNLVFFCFVLFLVIVRVVRSKSAKSLWSLDLEESVFKKAIWIKAIILCVCVFGIRCVRDNKKKYRFKFCTFFNQCKVRLLSCLLSCVCVCDNFVMLFICFFNLIFFLKKVFLNEEIHWQVNVL